jgi:MFS transporter, ACS family, D-galactonate transporter
MSSPWRFLFVLALATSINYIDRGSLSVAAPALSAELSITPAQIGLLLSAFSWSYVSFMIFAGWLADRYNPGWVLVAGFVVWSAATFATAFARSVGSLLVLRLVLGFGEAFAFPAIYKMIAVIFPADRRALPNSLIDVGGRVGAGLSTLLGGLLIAHFGWRPLFICLSLAGIMWLLPWFLSAPQRWCVIPASHPDAPGIREILKRRQAWGTFLGNFCCNYGYYFLLTWLPSYLVMERHLAINKTALWGSFPYCACAIASFCGGWASDRFIARGATPTRVRKSFLITGCLACTVMLPAYLVSSLAVSIALLTIAYIAIGLYASNVWAVSQALAGAAVGRWTGVQNAIGNVAGVAAPLATGLIVSKTGSFFVAFLSASVIAAAGALFYIFVVGEVSPIDWLQADKQLDSGYTAAALDGRSQAE